MSKDLDPAERERIEDARREAFAALAIASDRNCLPRHAAAHVRSGWAALRGPHDGDRDLAAWVKAQLASLDPKRAAATLAFVDTAGDDETLARLSDVEARELAAVLLRHLQAREYGVASVPSGLKSNARIWLKRFGLWAGGAVGFAVVALRPWEYQGVGQWHGAYYPGKDFRGEPDTRRQADVDFTWGALPPTDSIPADRFAARFTTCLRAPSDMEASFQLIADDAARLMIDGEDVIDLWEPEAGVEMPQSFGHTVELEAGVHALVVEYREEDEGAEVHLLATFEKGLPPGPVPSSMLEYPGEDFDEDDPCGSL